MSRYIDADIAKEKLKEYCVDNDSSIQYWYDLMGIDDCIDYNVPTADVRENVRGEWIKVKDDACSHYECSICKARPLYDEFCSLPELSDFCPNCGADMRGGDAE